MRVRIKHKWLLSGGEAWYLTPCFMTEYYDKQKRMHQKGFPISVHGYDQAWSFAVRDFCTRRKIPNEYSKILKLRPDPSVFVDYLKKRKRQDPKIQIDWKKFNTTIGLPK